MRLTKSRVRTLAAATVERLRTRGLLEVTATGSPARLTEVLIKAMDEELSVEDRLDAEVRTLLKQFDAEFQSRRSDYQRTFEMVKRKLVKDRGLAL